MNHGELDNCPALGPTRAREGLVRRQRVTIAPCRIFSVLAVLWSILAVGPVFAQVMDVSPTFHWTAPGDDGNTGRAATVVIRTALTADSLSEQWTSCRIVQTVTSPALAGLRETTETNLTLGRGTTNYFALKACDDAGNWSELSNIVQIEVAAFRPFRQRARVRIRP